MRKNEGVYDNQPIDPSEMPMNINNMKSQREDFQNQISFERLVSNQQIKSTNMIVGDRNQQLSGQSIRAGPKFETRSDDEQHPQNHNFLMNVASSSRGGLSSQIQKQYDQTEDNLAYEVFDEQPAGYDQQQMEGDSSDGESGLNF